MSFEAHIGKLPASARIVVMFSGGAQILGTIASQVDTTLVLQKCEILQPGAVKGIGVKSEVTINLDHVVAAWRVS